jgi:2,3-bisphosphoglycerate-dependent phosphoglycerate mutase
VTPPAQPHSPRSYRQHPFPSFPGATELLLIRHAESEAYVDGQPFPLSGGHGDPALSTEGAGQAGLLAGRLAGAHLDAIYVSPLRRTGQTAAPLAAATGLAPRVEADLREVHLGEWEGGQYRKMVAQRHPLVLQAWQEERWDLIPGAEAAEVFAARVGGAIERLAAAHPGQRVAVFTHGGVIGQVLATASGSRPFAFVTSDNASISRLVVTGGRWVIRCFNDTAHLSWVPGQGRSVPGAAAGQSTPGAAAGRRPGKRPPG